LSKAVAAIVLAPIIVLIAGIGGCEATKAYYDWQVRKLCEKDGGVTIYEYIRISPQIAALMGRVDGHLSIGDEAVAPPDDAAFLRRSKESVIRDGDPSVKRIEQIVIRRSDGKVIARVVRYWRTGGDFPFTASHPSHFSCPDSQRHYAEVAEIFVVEEKSK
jgi:hypothetical protein